MLLRKLLRKIFYITSSYVLPIAYMFAATGETDQAAGYDNH